METDKPLDKRTTLQSLKDAFLMCSQLSQRPHRISPSQRIELIKTMAYLSQVIGSLEKDVNAKAVHERQSAENNVRALVCLQEDGIIEIKDMRKLRVLMGCEEKEEATEGTPCSPQS